MAQELGKYQHHVVYPLLRDRVPRRVPDREAGCRGNSVSMCSDVWRWLPTEIKERVFLFLPAVAQSRSQLVCRAWRLLLTSPGFREESSSRALAYHRMCLLWHPDYEFAKVDHPLTVDLSFIPDKFQGSRIGCSRFGFYDSGFSWMWEIQSDENLWLLLVNLEKKTCIELPPLPLLSLAEKEDDIDNERTGLFFGNVVQLQEHGDLFFHIPVLFECDDESLCVAKYSSSIGVWTTCWLPSNPNRFYGGFAFYKDSRLYVLYGKHEAAGPKDKRYWLLACFDTEDGSWVAEGCLPESLLRFSRDHFLAHSRGVYCIRMRETMDMEPTVSILSWTIMFSEDDLNEDEFSQVSDLRRVSVLTAKHMDRGLRGGCIERVEMINNTILILFTWARQHKPVLRVMGYDLQEKSWRRLVY